MSTSLLSNFRRESRIWAQWAQASFLSARLTLESVVSLDLDLITLGQVNQTDLSVCETESSHQKLVEPPRGPAYLLTGTSVWSLESL